jgi:hypothetical protein
MDQQGNRGTCSNKDHPSKGEGTGRNPYSSGNLQHMTSKAFAFGGEEEKKKKLAPPPTLAPSLSHQIWIRRCSIAPSQHHIG